MKIWDYELSVQYFLLVSEMRQAQQLYFKHRTSNYLDTAKKLEKKIDELNTKYLNALNQNPLLLK